jgi:hypothetical protein
MSGESSGFVIYSASLKRKFLVNALENLKRPGVHNLYLSYLISLSKSISAVFSHFISDGDYARDGANKDSFSRKTTQCRIDSSFFVPNTTHAQLEAVVQPL